MSDTETATLQPVPTAQPASVVTNDIATANNINTTLVGSVVPVTSNSSADITTTLNAAGPTATLVPTPTPTPTPTLSTRLLSVVTTDFEAAVADLDSLVSGPDSYIKTWVEANAAKIRSMAEADYVVVVAEKKKLVADLESEMTSAGSWLSSKLAAIRAKL